MPFFLVPAPSLCLQHKLLMTDLCSSGSILALKIEVVTSLSVHCIMCSGSIRFRESWALFYFVFCPRPPTPHPSYLSSITLTLTFCVFLFLFCISCSCGACCHKQMRPWGKTEHPASGETNDSFCIFKVLYKSKITVLGCFWNCFTLRKSCHLGLPSRLVATEISDSCFMLIVPNVSWKYLKF